MNDTFGNDPPDPAGARERGQIPFPTNWQSALSGLVAARIAILQAEGSEAAAVVVKKIIAGAAAAILALFIWALLLAGGIGAIAAATQFPWYWITLITAGIHILIVIGLVRVVRTPGPPSFTVTRSEFQKDLEWLQAQKKTGK